MYIYISPCMVLDSLAGGAAVASKFRTSSVLAPHRIAGHDSYTFLVTGKIRARKWVRNLEASATGDESDA